MLAGRWDDLRNRSYYKMAFDSDRHRGFRGIAEREELSDTAGVCLVEAVGEPRQVGVSLRRA